MKKITFFLLPMLFLLSCSPGPNGDKSNTTDTNTVTSQNKTNQKKLLKKEKLISGAHAVKEASVAEKEASLKKLKSQKIISNLDKTPQISVETAEKQGKNLGLAYCKCIKEEKENIAKCDGIQKGVASIVSRYKGEIGGTIVNAFKETVKTCK